MGYFYDNMFGVFPKIQRALTKEFIDGIIKTDIDSFEYLMDYIAESSPESDDIATNVLGMNGYDRVCDWLEVCFEDTNYPDEYEESVYDLDDGLKLYYFELFTANVIADELQKRLDEYGVDIDDDLDEEYVRDSFINALERMDEDLL